MIRVEFTIKEIPEQDRYGKVLAQFDVEASVDRAFAVYMDALSALAQPSVSTESGAA